MPDETKPVKLIKEGEVPHPIACPKCGCPHLFVDKIDMPYCYDDIVVTCSQCMTQIERFETGGHRGI